MSETFPILGKSRVCCLNKSARTICPEAPGGPAPHIDTENAPVLRNRGMNFPGFLKDLNWTWRAKDGIIGERLTEKIKKLTEIHCRTGSKKN